MNLVVVLAAAQLSWALLAKSDMPYMFPSGIEDVVPDYKTSFTCDERIYGYYADVDNDCKIFHICMPVANANGRIVDTAQYSFFCPKQTVFNQESLTCSFPEFSLPCEHSQTFYDIVNTEFGRVD